LARWLRRDGRVIRQKADPINFADLLRALRAATMPPRRLVA